MSQPPNAISIAPAIFAQCQCDQHTDTERHKQTHRPRYVRHLWKYATSYALRSCCVAWYTCLILQKYKQ